MLNDWHLSFRLYFKQLDEVYTTIIPILHKKNQGSEGLRNLSMEFAKMHS